MLHNFSCKKIWPFETIIKEMKALNIYQINLIQTLKFMHKTKYGINPRIFLPKFREVDHQYPTRFSQNSFYYKRSACKTTSFAITHLDPTIWNSFLGQHEKSTPHLLSFSKQIKFKLLNSRKQIMTYSSVRRYFVVYFFICLF